MKIDKLVPVQNGFHERIEDGKIIREPKYWISNIVMMNKINEMIDFINKDVECEHEFVPVPEYNSDLGIITISTKGICTKCGYRP